MSSVNTQQQLVAKLATLNTSQQSIETISAWCTFYRKQARLIVETWSNEFATAQLEKKLALLFLANDILQNSRKKGPEYVDAFFRVLPKALRHVVKYGDAKAAKCAARLVEIWKERRVFGSGLEALKDAIAVGIATFRKQLSFPSQYKASIHLWEI